MGPPLLASGSCCLSTPLAGYVLVLVYCTCFYQNVNALGFHLERFHLGVIYLKIAMRY